MNDRRVAYWEGGDPQGRPVLLIHGLGGDHRGLLDCISPLSRYRLIVPDLPGYGLSETFGGEHTVEAYADFIESLLHHLHLTDIVLIGYSFGAIVALTYAKHNPKQLRQLVLLNPVVNTPPNMLGKVGKLCMSAIYLLPERMGHWVVTNKFTVYVTDRVVMTTKGKPYRKKILQEDYLSYKLTSLRALREGMASLDTMSTAKLIPGTAVDTLLVAGTKDVMVSITRSQTLAQKLAAQLVELDGGHLLPLEDPVAVGLLLKQYIQR